MRSVVIGLLGTTLGLASGRRVMCSGMNIQLGRHLLPSVAFIGPIHRQAPLPGLS